MASRLHIHRLSIPRRLRIEGELDLDSCGEVSAALDELGTDGDVMMDMSGISFIDCTGLNVLLLADRDHRAAGSRFVIVNPSDVIQRLFELTATDCVFFIEAREV